MQGVRPSFSTKKLANVNMPSMLLGLGKASKAENTCVGNGQLLRCPKVQEGQQGFQSGYLFHSAWA
jgi:hypothetical protein